MQYLYLQFRDFPVSEKLAEILEFRMALIPAQVNFGVVNFKSYIGYFVQ